MPKGIDYIINITEGNFKGASQAKAALGEIDEKAAKVGDVFTHVGKNAAEAFKADKLADLGKKSEEVFNASEKATARVAKGIKSSTGAAGASMKKLNEQASALSKKSIMGDKQQTGAKLVASAMSSLGGEILGNTLPAVQTLATHLGGDVSKSATLLGKSFGDPIKALGELKKEGVKFSAEQKKLIEQDVKSGNVNRARAMILGQVAGKIGTTTEASRKAIVQLTGMNDKIEEGKKAVKSYMTEGLQKMMPLLSEGAGWFKENQSKINDLGKVIGIGQGIWQGYQKAVGEVEKIQKAWNTAASIGEGVQKVLKIAVGESGIATDVLTASQWLLNVAMDANPVGLIIIGIAALAGGLYLAYQKSETFRAVLAGVGEVAKEIMPVFQGLGDIIIGMFSFNPLKIAEGFKEAYDGVKKIATDGGISGAFKRGYNESLKESHQKDADDQKDTVTTNNTNHPALTGGKPKADGKGAGKGDAATGKGKGKDKDADDAATGKGDGKGISAVFNNQSNTNISQTASSQTSVGGGKGRGGEAVAGGGGRNVRVTIGKLVEHLTIQNTNVAGLNNADIKRQITEMLVGIVHDSEMALGH